MKCARACKNTQGCTHFDFYVSSGTCTKKKNSVEKTEAYWKGSDVFCGLMRSMNFFIFFIFYLRNSLVSY